MNNHNLVLVAFVGKLRQCLWPEHSMEGPGAGSRERGLTPRCVGGLHARAPFPAPLLLSLVEASPFIQHAILSLACSWQVRLFIQSLS